MTDDEIDAAKARARQWWSDFCVDINCQTLQPGKKPSQFYTALVSLGLVLDGTAP